MGKQEYISITAQDCTDPNALSEALRSYPKLRVVPQGDGVVLIYGYIDSDYTEHAFRIVQRYGRIS